MNTWIDRVILPVCYVTAVVLVVLNAVVLLSGCLDPQMYPIPAVTGAAGKLAGAVNSTNFLVPLSILGVALSCVAMATGAFKTGLMGVIGSLAALVLTLAINRYANLMAAGGALAAVLAVATGIVLKYRATAGQAVKAGTALAQVVQGVQKVKTYVAGTFAREDINKALASEQSPETQKLVENVKSGLSPI